MFGCRKHLEILNELIKKFAWQMNNFYIPSNTTGYKYICAPCITHAPHMRGYQSILNQIL